MAAKFVIKKGTTGKFRFNLVATNGQVVATSESYETKRAVLAGVASVRKIAATAALVDDTAVIAAATKTAAKKAAAKTAAKKTAAKKTVSTLG